MMTPENFVRALLERAIQDDLVERATKFVRTLPEKWTKPRPHSLR